MKNKIIVVLGLCLAIPSIALPSSDNPHGTNAKRGVTQLSISAVDNPPSTSQPTNPDVTPGEQNETPLDYEAAMVAITQRFSATLAAIADAVTHGELSREKGKEMSADLYELSQMQLQLLSLWREISNQDPVQPPEAQTNPAATQNNEIVMVELPFSSLQLNPSLAAYLNLTPTQVEAIQHLMARERETLDPLMTELRHTREKFLAIDSDHMNRKEVKGLADAEARLLAKLIVGNARMRSKIYKVLSPDQQKKLKDLER